MGCGVGGDEACERVGVFAMVDGGRFGEGEGKAGGWDGDGDGHERGSFTKKRLIC